MEEGPTKAPVARDLQKSSCSPADRGPMVGTCCMLVCQGVFQDPCWNFWGEVLPNS